MEIKITEIWASPSTLHLRLVVRGKGNKWMKFHSVSCPLDAIPSEVRRLIQLSEAFDREPEPEDQGALW